MNRDTKVIWVTHLIVAQCSNFVQKTEKVEGHGPRTRHSSTYFERIPRLLNTVYSFKLESSDKKGMRSQQRNAAFLTDGYCSLESSSRTQPNPKSIQNVIICFTCSSVHGRNGMNFSNTIGEGRSRNKINYISSVWRNRGLAVWFGLVFSLQWFGFPDVSV